ncbi:hypothetical protein M434DRAFT_88089 [Hypoxylon sp. CO27-5]|nr:hypothetical protein M434DRAFT_88089 [Hypoxylon sp. CO27-5]
MAPLSQSQISIIKATVPVLQTHGETITKTFYENMLKAHPELNNIFNTTSQITNRQPRALAHAVLAYATHIDDLTKLTGAVQRIAQQHVSLFVQPEQYDIVGTYLLGAIGQVLADAATPEIVDAWTAAYGVLAKIFIDTEQQLYKADENWTGWRKFRIAKKRQEADDITSFQLEPVDGVVPLPAFLPGQYVSLQIPVPKLGYNQSRQYSLSQAPLEDDARTYRVSVKREHDDELNIDGIISNMLSDGYNEGDVVELSHPHGLFTLDPADISKESAPVVLISAGVGVTPLVSMLQALARPSSVKRPISWIHTSRSKAKQPFADEVVAIVEDIEDRVSAHVHLRHGLNGEEKPRLDILALDRERDLFVHDRRTEYYICGPETFMLELRTKLTDLGVDKERVYLELFATGEAGDE